MERQYDKRCAEAFFTEGCVYILYGFSGNGIAHSGIINWEFLATKPTDAVSILYNTFTYSFRNLAGNIALFIPLGLLYPLCKKRRVSFPHILIVTAGATALIELLQFAFLSSRSADVDDLILNFIGGMIGYLIYKWIE